MRNSDLRRPTAPQTREFAQFSVRLSGDSSSGASTGLAMAAQSRLQEKRRRQRNDRRARERASASASNSTEDATVVWGGSDGASPMQLEQAEPQSEVAKRTWLTHRDRQGTVKRWPIPLRPVRP